TSFAEFKMLMAFEAFDERYGLSKPMVEQVVTKLQRESGAGMTNKFLLNDAEHWRTRAEEARLVAKEMKASETKNALLRIGDNYEHLAQWVEDWALRCLSRN